MMRYVSIIIDIFNKIIDVYEANAKTTSPKRALLMQKISWISEWTLIGGFFTYIIFGTLQFTYPIYGYFWQHEIKPLFPLYLPFVDEKTTVGYVILMLIQCTEMYLSLVGSACTDFIFMVLIINVSVFSTIFEDNVIELNEILRENKVDMPAAKTKLRGIFELYHDIWM